MFSPHRIVLYPLMGISLLGLLGVLLWFRKPYSIFAYPYACLGAGLAYISLVGFWMWRNNALTGSFSGAVRAPSTIGLGENLLDTGNAFTLLFPSHPLSYLISSLLSVFILLRLHKSTLSHTTPHLSAIGIWIGLVGSGSYLGGLVLLRTWQDFDTIGMRLIAPAIPFLLIALLISGYMLARSKSKTAVFGLFAIIWVLSASTVEGIRTYVEIRMQMNNRYGFLFRDSPSSFYSNPAFFRFSVLSLIIKELDSSPHNIFIVDDPKLASVIHIALDRNARLLPDVINETALSNINTLGTGFLILTQPSSIERLHQYYQQHFSQISIDSGYLKNGYWVTALPLPKLFNHPSLRH